MSVPTIPRSGMEALIARARDLIHDPDGASAHFGAGEIQDALDRYKSFVRYAQLRYQFSVNPDTGATEWKEFFCGLGDWEDGATFVNTSWQPYDPATYTFDAQTGYLSFTSSVVPPVKISGQTYDIFAAAADLLRRWASSVKTGIRKFSEDGQTIEWGNQASQLLDLAATYENQQRGGAAALGRDDLNPQW